jgi:hypothetical protein
MQAKNLVYETLREKSFVYLIKLGMRYADAMMNRDKCRFVGMAFCR